MNAPDQRVKYEKLLDQLRAAGAELYNLAVSANPTTQLPKYLPLSYLPIYPKLNIYHTYPTILTATEKQPVHPRHRLNRKPIRLRPAIHNTRVAQPTQRIHGSPSRRIRRMASGLDISGGRLARHEQQPPNEPRRHGSLERRAQRHDGLPRQQHVVVQHADGPGLLRHGRRYERGPRRRVLDDAFWTTFNWGRRVARGAIDGGHAYVRKGDGVVVELDALLVPNDDVGGGSQACASIPSYAGYPVAAVPVGQTVYGVPFGLCVWGREWSEAGLVRVASAMEDLFRWEDVPRWHNYETAEGIWEATWPGYACSTDSLDSYACEPEV